MEELVIRDATGRERIWQPEMEDSDGTPFCTLREGKFEEEFERGREVLRRQGNGEAKGESR